jgi:alkanesulfonate monooxygenase SsuD/methylene tetrahydromethanopterin reductase-like flavin-dependent oxidoreductase (luciferase family)
MRFGVYLPNFGAETSALALAELAGEAEKARWDGFFLWDHILANKNQKLPMVDPWIALTAIAMQTRRIRFGTTVTPIARRRPWKLARETTTLDNLSGGRLILSVGLGEPGDAEFAAFGEEADPRVRAEKLDEGLDVLNGLWRGRAFSYQGRHYHLDKVTFRPTPLQKPHIPIWVGGWWPNKAPFRRAARWDGVIPLNKHGIWIKPPDLEEMLAYIHAHRTSKAPFDAVIIGARHDLGKDGAAIRKSRQQLEQAGATWWLQSMYQERNSLEAMRAAIRQGPPKNS